VRTPTGVYWLHADHLGSASLTTDATGNRVGELRYKPYGETRSEWGVTPTGRRFTGQLEESGLGSLYDYGARRYSPVLGRFISADSIVPRPGNPQSLNRYAYVLGNPLRYTDPSGHFTNDQLTAWFGKEWRQNFLAWQRMLEKAELGDAVVYGSMTAVFVLDESSLKVWDIKTRSAGSVSNFAATGSGQLALYRSRNANPEGGATKNYAVFFPGEHTDPHAALANRSNHYNWVFGDLYAPDTLVLPLDWYRGTNTHVEVRGYFAGLDWDVGDVFSDGVTAVALGVAVKKIGIGAGKRLGNAVLGTLGGPVGATAFMVDLADDTMWDTMYVIEPGPGAPHIVPVPTPPRPQGTPTPR